MSLAELAIGWLAPPQCVGCEVDGVWLCEACRSSEVLVHGERCGFCGAVSAGCRTCASCRKSAPSQVYITTDYVGLPQKLLKAYKYQHTRAINTSIAQLMAETFNYLCDRKYLIIPVPTATTRVRQRGFDHSALLAKSVAKQLGFEQAQALSRIGQSRQVGAHRAERLRQLDGVFFVRRPEHISGQSVLLIDDVITTGGTLKAATKALRHAGARRVDALVFAKRL